MRHVLIFGLFGPPGSYLCCRLFTRVPPSWLGWGVWLALAAFLLSGAIDAALSHTTSAWERVIVAAATGFCIAAVLHWLLIGNGIIAFAFIVPAMLCSLISTGARPKDGWSIDEEIDLRR